MKFISQIKALSLAACAIVGCAVISSCDNDSDEETIQSGQRQYFMGDYTSHEIPYAFANFTGNGSGAYTCNLAFFDANPASVGITEDYASLNMGNMVIFTFTTPTAALEYGEINAKVEVYSSVSVKASLNAKDEEIAPYVLVPDKNVYKGNVKLIVAKDGSLTSFAVDSTLDICPVKVSSDTDENKVTTFSYTVLDATGTTSFKLAWLGQDPAKGIISTEVTNKKGDKIMINNIDICNLAGMQAGFNEMAAAKETGAEEEETPEEPQTPETPEEPQVPDAPEEQD